MKRWTPEAEQRLEDYLDEVLTLARDHGESDEDFVDELRLHIRSDAEESAGGLVTRQNLERALAAAGRPHDVVGVEPQVLAASQPTRNGNGARSAEPHRIDPTPLDDDSVRSPLPRIMMGLCGVLLPCIAMAMELYLISVSGAGGVGVMPTLLHVALIAAVPVLNFWLLLWADEHADLSRSRDRVLIRVALGFLIGVSGAYALLLAPLTPFAILAILYIGLGFIGLAPLLSLWCAVRTMNAFCRRGLFTSGAGRGPWLQLLAGLGIALASLTGYWGLQEFREHHTRMVVVGGDEVQGRSLRWLRVVGAPDPSTSWMRVEGITSLWDGMLSDIFSASQARLSRKELEQVAFRVSGEVSKAGESGSRWRTTNLFSQRWEILNQQGREEVGTMIPGLSLAGSSLEVNLMGDGLAESGLSYTEWVMEFSNNNPEVNEARCVIALPPGAVASRLTLWINGVECEAAFGGAGQVKAAYQDVAIVRRQDPALLTNPARGENFLQCFPVPAFGKMKVKVGVTAPLHVLGGKTSLSLPRLAGENFLIPEHFSHALQVLSARAVSAGHPSLTSIESDGGSHSLTGLVRHRDWEREPDALVLAVDGEVPLGIFEGRLGPYRATMEVAKVAPGKDRNVWLVIDGSSGVGGANLDWAAFINAFPEDARLHAVFAHFTPEVWDENGGREVLIDWIQSREFAFGQRLVPALRMALLRANSTTNSEVIAIHGPQPFDDPVTETILGALRVARRNHAPVPVRLVAAASGPNLLSKAMVNAGEVEVFRADANVQERLEYLARVGSASDVLRRYTLALDEAGAEGGAHGTNAHVVRLAALEQVMRLLRSESPVETQEAIAIAKRCRLVTPVTGAVVLENQEQYARHGLDDGDSLDAVPAVPEPEEWLLMGVAALALCGAWYHRSRMRALEAI